jgi:SAM-dependent methyltransferase/uncharacterized protein YbaR (Trm112 family)
MSNRMQQPHATRLSPDVLADMRCPVCHAQVSHSAESLTCSACSRLYPIVQGVPIIINEADSVFRIDEYTGGTEQHMTEPPPSLKTRIRNLIPKPSLNLMGPENYQRYADLITKQCERPRVLVLGGRILGQGMEPIAGNSAIQLVETDVCFGPRTSLICDAHDVPFADASFDGVIIQAVLEHVCDPFRVVAEIHRVLKPGGLIYAETPFMQQVHARAWDFTRFTELGHRRLFRKFEEIDRGACCGTGMALAWAWQYFLLSFTSIKPLRTLLRVFAELSSFWLIHLDRLTLKTKGTQDAASGFYFLGRRSDKVLTDRELISQFRGEWC